VPNRKDHNLITINTRQEILKTDIPRLFLR